MKYYTINLNLLNNILTLKFQGFVQEKFVEKEMDHLDNKTIRKEIFAHQRQKRYVWVQGNKVPDDNYGLIVGVNPPNGFLSRVSLQDPTSALNYDEPAHFKVTRRNKRSCPLFNNHEGKPFGLYDFSRPERRVDFAKLNTIGYTVKKTKDKTKNHASYYATLAPTFEAEGGWSVGQLAKYKHQIAYASCAPGWVKSVRVSDGSKLNSMRDPEFIYDARRCGIASTLSQSCLMDGSTIDDSNVAMQKLLEGVHGGRARHVLSIRKKCKKLAGVQIPAKGDGLAYLKAAKKVGFTEVWVQEELKDDQNEELPLANIIEFIYYHVTKSYGECVAYVLKNVPYTIDRAIIEVLRNFGRSQNVLQANCEPRPFCRAYKGNWYFCKEK